MEEEKKNNKGLMVGIIIFLIICLVAIFYFMFKMTYVGDKNTTPTESNNTETTKKNEVIFTTLTKYELQEGEEKEITVDGKTITLKSKDGKYYINEKETEAYTIVYVTNSIIFVTRVSDSGEVYEIYDSDAKLIEKTENLGYENLRIENEKLYVTLKGTIIDHGVRKINNIAYGECNVFTEENQKASAKIIEKHKEDGIEIKYEIKYRANQITFEFVENETNLSEYIQANPKTCVTEIQE